MKRTSSTKQALYEDNNRSVDVLCLSRGHRDVDYKIEATS